LKQLLGVFYIPVIRKSMADKTSFLNDRQSQIDDPICLFGIPAICCVISTYSLLLILIIGFSIFIIPFQIFFLLEELQFLFLNQIVMLFEHSIKYG